jgi:hypothetical protein
MASISHQHPRVDKPGDLDQRGGRPAAEIGKPDIARVAIEAIDVGREDVELGRSYSNGVLRVLQDVAEIGEALREPARACPPRPPPRHWHPRAVIPAVCSRRPCGDHAERKRNGVSKCFPSVRTVLVHAISKHPLTCRMAGLVRRGQNLC